MKQIENTLQDLKCMLIEDGYTEANIVLRTLIKAQEQVKNNDLLHSVSGWHSFHQHPKENSLIDLMWSDNSINRLTYTRQSYNSIDFSLSLIPIKWRYA